MPDLIPTVDRSDRLSLAASFALFAGAGTTNAAGGAPAPTIGATVLAVGGVYCTARYASTVSRKELAQLALGLWIGFLGITGFHVVGLETVTATVSGPGSAVLVHSLLAVTWASLLAACAATVFLGFREYASTGTVDVPEEQVLDGETTSTSTSDYSTR